MTTAAKETAVVTGGGRGLGRGIVEALAPSMNVVALARTASELADVAKATGAKTVVGDAADEAVAERVLREFRPNLTVLCAGVAPLLKPLHEQTWEAFSHNWSVDTKQTFNWVRNILLSPQPGNHVIVISSGAALRGSPVSGGYAAAKRAQWFIADYAAQESARLGLGLRFHCLLPALNASSELGRSAIAAYAERTKMPPEEFVKRFGPPLTPAILGRAVAELHADPAKWDQLAYQVSGNGLAPVP